MKKLSRNLVIIIITLAALAIIVFVLNKNKSKNEAETAIVAQQNEFVNVEVDTVKYAVINTAHKSNGVFAPLQELQMSAEQSGRVLKVFVKEGDRVSIGQPLALVKADQISVDLEKAKAAYQNAKTNYTRYSEAFKSGGVTKQDVDKAKLDLSNAEAALNQSKISYGDATIKAPINGIINLKTVEPGTVVSPGTSLFEIVNISSLKFKTSISESRIATIKQGDTININVSAIPDKTFQGVVSFIAPKADEALSFPVELEVTNTVNTMLKAGMYGSVNFETSSSKKLSINRKAFVGSMSSQQVFVLKPDNTVVLTKVVTGISTENSVEIVNGLSKGDIVVTNGQINLDDGTKVKVMNKANSNNQSK